MKNGTTRKPRVTNHNIILESIVNNMTIRETTNNIVNCGFCGHTFNVTNGKIRITNLIESIPDNDNELAAIANVNIIICKTCFDTSLKTTFLKTMSDI